MERFYQTYVYKNVKIKTGLKNPINQTCASLVDRIFETGLNFDNACIGLINKNRQKWFQEPDFHKLSLTVMKVFYNKNFPNEDFMHELRVPNRSSLETFKTSLDSILQKHASVKKRYMSGNIKLHL